MNFLYHHGIKGQKWGVRRFHDISLKAVTRCGVLTSCDCFCLFV